MAKFTWMEFLDVSGIEDTINQLPNEVTNEEIILQLHDDSYEDHEMHEVLLVDEPSLLEVNAHEDDAINEFFRDDVTPGIVLQSYFL